MAEQALSQRKLAGLLRWRRTLDPLDDTHVRLDGRVLVNFCANDYLGLAHHPQIIEVARQAAGRYGAGASASGLISGHTEAHAAAETDLARWKGTESAILLPSGYQANHAAIQTLAAVGEQAGRRPLFLLDRLVHGSLIDAVRGAGAPFRVYPHQGYAKLDRLLRACDDAWAIVVTESVFSMDGDTLAVGPLAELKARHGFTLLVDEAHGSGVYGRDGAGWLAEAGAEQLADMTVVTLSKALGCAGGAICAGRALVEAAVNFGRAYIYSTALSPILVESTRAALGILRAEPDRQARVRRHARRARAALGMAPSDSPILPIVLGEEQAALRAGDALLEAGLLVLAIRPPTVPRGTSRLRITFSSEHTDAQVDRLIGAVRGAIG